MQADLRFWHLASFVVPHHFSRFRRIDGVIGRPACRSLEILGAALQADGETRSAFAASSIRRRSVSHGPFCRTRRISQGDQRLHCG
jgi:hypothetical protein